MEDQVNQSQGQPSSEATEENLNEQDLAAIGGGISTAIALGTLRRSFSESDVTRLSESDTNHILNPPSSTGSPASSMSSGNHGPLGSPGSIEESLLGGRPKIRPING